MTPSRDRTRLGLGTSLPARAPGRGHDGDVSGADVSTPDAFFAEHPLGLAAFDRVCEMLGETGAFEVRVSRSQVGFRRRRGFAYLWLPGQYLRNPTAEVVLSIPLDRRDDSPRFKEVVAVSPRHWMHHLELRAVGDLDDEVLAWLREAADLAG